MRSKKFWNKNEKEVMRRLGLKPAIASGAGWIEKEDGENEEYIAQLKSTENMNITVSLKDIKTLIYHANVSHKTPVLVLQFLNECTLVCFREQDIENLNGEEK